MINAGMVFCDRHYGGINYPKGGVGRIPEVLAEGLRERGSHLVYKANVSIPSVHSVHACSPEAHHRPFMHTLN